MKGRGDGRIFRMKGSPYWWISYYHHGQEHREVVLHLKTGKKIEATEQNYREAELFLRERRSQRDAEKHGGLTFLGPKQDRIKISCDLMAIEEQKAECTCLCCALERDFRLRGKDSTQNMSNLDRVRRDFGGQRATALGAEEIDQYVEKCGGEGAAPASVNRTLQLLGQAFRLAIQRKRLTGAPYIRHLSEKGNVRQGFFCDAEFQLVITNLPDYLRDFARFAYLTGMRKREATSLRWNDVQGDVIELRAENAKNGEARTVLLEGELAQLIERRRDARQVRKPNKPVLLSGWIFHHDGKPVGDFRKAWATACCKAGIGELLCPNCKIAVDAQHKCAKCSQSWTREELKYAGRVFHDFRRTAVRDMVRAGVPETVAMSISGHRTRSMFDRYNITDERDRRQALRAMQEYRQQQSVAQPRVNAMPPQRAGIK